MSDGTVTGRLERLAADRSLVAARMPLAILAVVVLLRPILGLDLVPGGGYIASTILLMMLFAAAYNLLLGYTGLLSFGHAMFLGAGMYGAAIGVARFDLPFVVAAAIGVVVAAVLAYVIGKLTVHRGEIYFAMLTLAFGMAAHFVVNADPLGLTGGSDGIRRSALPEWVSSFRGQTVVEAAGMEFDLYYLVAAVFLVSLLVLWQVGRSPFGRTLVAIRDNEELARSMGVSTLRYKVYAFTISGAFSAIAGAVMVLDNGGAALEDMSVIMSGDVLLMTIFGGANYFFGPIVGAFTWFVARESLTSFEVLHLPTEQFTLVTVDLGGVLGYWQFFFGLAFVIVVLVAPREGIWGFVRGRVLAVVAAARRRTQR